MLFFQTNNIEPNISILIDNGVRMIYNIL